MRHRLLLLLATATAIAACSGAAAPATAATSGDALARAVGGHLDAVVTNASGRTVGHLTASVLRSGPGAGQLRVHGAGSGASELVHFRAGRAGTGARIVVARHRTVRLDLRIGADGALRGTGRIEGRPVRIRGVAGERLEHVRRGQDMLLIGRPSGPAYDALRKLLRPVRFDASDHGAHKLLTDRKELHRFGALVVGAGVTAGDERVQAVLHRFFGTGKWVVAAPGSAALRRSLSDLHGTPFDGDTGRGMAVRTTGASGTSSNVRPLVRFPAAVRGRLTPVQRKAVAASQARWFRAQLLAHGKAHDGIPEERRTRARAAAASSTSFNPPFNAAVVEIRVPYHHMFTMSESQVHRKLPVCGQSVEGRPDQYNTQCPGEGWPTTPPFNPNYPTDRPCQTYLAQGKRVLPWASVQLASWNPLPWGNSDIPSPLIEGMEPDYMVNGNIGDGWMQIQGFMAAFEGWHGSTCPEAGSQVGLLQGNDYYYGILEPSAGAHTVVVLTDPTVSAAAPDVPPGRLFKTNEANGVMRACYDFCGNHPLTETAWFLGSYDHGIALSGDYIADGAFEYSTSRSFPVNDITFATNSTGESKSRSFSFGIFGDTGTGTFESTDTESAEVTVNVPSWTVTANPGTRDVHHTFVTNTPVDWPTIQGHSAFPQKSGYWQLGARIPGPANAPFTLNEPNVRAFGPSALAVWTGDRTYGPVKLTGTHTLGMVDHFTYLDLHPPHGYFRDAFAVEYEAFSDSPDAIAPSVTGKDTTTLGTGLNFCDPHVRDPTFLDECKKLYPTTGP